MNQKLEERVEQLEQQKSEFNSLYLGAVEKYKNAMTKDSIIVEEGEVSAYKIKIGECRKILNEVSLSLNKILGLLVIISST